MEDLQVTEETKFLFARAFAGMIDEALETLSPMRHTLRQDDETVWKAYTDYLDIDDRRKTAKDVLPLMHLTPDEHFVFTVLDQLVDDASRRIALPKDDVKCAKELMAHVQTDCTVEGVADAIRKFKERVILVGLGDTSRGRHIFRLMRRSKDAVLLTIRHRPAVPMHAATRCIWNELQRGGFKPPTYVKSMRSALLEWLRQEHPRVNAVTVVRTLVGYCIDVERPRWHLGCALIVDSRRPTLLVAVEGFEAIDMMPGRLPMHLRYPPYTD